ncbi:hypothetical protein D3C75_333260 [compost metagenome]
MEIPSNAYAVKDLIKECFDLETNVSFLEKQADNVRIFTQDGSTYLMPTDEEQKEFIELLIQRRQQRLNEISAIIIEINNRLRRMV